MAAGAERSVSTVSSFRTTSVLFIGVVTAALVAGCVGGAVTQSLASGSPTATVSFLAGATPSPTPSQMATASTLASATPRAEPTVAGTFRLTGSMTTARYGQTATRLSDGRVLIVGGGLAETDASIQSAYASAELYDPATGTFKATGSMHQARGNHTATLLSDGRVLIAGGSNELGNPTRAELYDPASGTFSLTGAPGAVRQGATAVLLHDGRVLIAGGFRGGTPPGPMASAELYDPATGKFSPTGSMSVVRMYATGALLPDGRVLVVGGSDPGTPYASAELYNPATGRFTTTGSMSTGRSHLTSALLADGRVLVAGGWNFNAANISAALASAELYDPKTGRFAETGTMLMPCAGPATALADGRVLMVGCSDGTSDPTSAELYDPKTGTFTATGSMFSVQSAATATLLSDGRVLVAGGFDDQNAIATAELYEP